jgi:hypothetical protein
VFINLNQKQSVSTWTDGTDGDKFKTHQSAVKVACFVFWDSREVILNGVSRHCENYITRRSLSGKGVVKTFSITITQGSTKPPNIGRNYEAGVDCNATTPMQPETQNP